MTGMPLLCRRERRDADEAISARFRKCCPIGVQVLPNWSASIAQLECKYCLIGVQVLPDRNAIGQQLEIKRFRPDWSEGREGRCHLVFYSSMPCFGDRHFCAIALVAFPYQL